MGEQLKVEKTALSSLSHCLFILTSLSTDAFRPKPSSVCSVNTRMDAFYHEGVKGQGLQVNHMTPTGELHLRVHRFTTCSHTRHSTSDCTK